MKYHYRPAFDSRVSRADRYWKNRLRVVGNVAKGKYQKWLASDGRLLLEAWARDGLTDEQIAHNMGVRRSTLADWKNKFPDISDALKKGKEVVDVEVENALLKRAKGYAYIEEKQEISATGLRTVTKIVKQVPPDVGAAVFWLKNRKPDVWREKQAEQRGLSDDEDDNFYEAVEEAVNKS